MRSWKAVAAVALILACASMLFTVVLSARTHSNAEHARRDLAVQTRSTLLSSCERGNTLRRTQGLQGLILNGIPTTRQYVHEGTLVPATGPACRTSGPHRGAQDRAGGVRPGVSEAPLALKGGSHGR
jgi:hypothetical protein